MPHLIASGPFAAPWMLLWGLSAAFPLLLHLWGRSHRQRTRWAAMQFLVAAVDRERHRFQVRQWLLLAVRAAILLTFAAAIADPRLSPSPAEIPAGDLHRTHRVIVVDASYSMARSGEGGTAYESAVAEAKKIVAASTEGDGYSLFQVTEPSPEVIRDVVFDKSDMIAEIDALEMPHTVGGLLPTLTEVEQTVNRVADNYPDLQRCRVYFVTDLGLPTWKEVTSAGVAQRLAALAEQAELHVVQVESEQDSNLGLVQLSSTQPWPVAGHSNGVEARIRNYNAREMTTRIELLLDGTPIASRAVTVPPASDAVEVFSVTVDSTGSHVIEGRLPEDSLDVDNQRWLSLLVPSELRVLCVEGQAGEAEFVTAALSASSTQRQSARTTVVPTIDLLERSLTDFDCVALCNVPTISDNAASRLRTFVSEGGGLIVFLGSRVRTENYNSVLGSADRELLPAELREVRRFQWVDHAPDESAFRIDPAGYQHTIVAPFENHERAGLVSVPVWSYQVLHPATESAEVVFRMNDGGAAMVSSRVGDGRCVVMSPAVSPLSVDNAGATPTPWSALPVWPCFPPLIRETVQFSAAGRLARMNIRVGEAISGSVRNASAGRRQIEGPDGTTNPVTVNHRLSPPRWLYSRTHLSGIYRVAAHREGERDQRFAVNVDPQEATGDQLSFDALPAEFSPADDAEPEVGSRSLDRPPGALFRVLLAAVFLLLLVELGLANRGFFGVR